MQTSHTPSRGRTIIDVLLQKRARSSQKQKVDGICVQGKKLSAQPKGKTIKTEFHDYLICEQIQTIQSNKQTLIPTFKKPSIYNIQFTIPKPKRKQQPKSTERT